MRRRHQREYKREVPSTEHSARSETPLLHLQLDVSQGPQKSSPNTWHCCLSTWNMASVTGELNFYRYLILIINLNCDAWLMATILDSAGAENGSVGDRQSAHWDASRVILQEGNNLALNEVVSEGNAAKYCTCLGEYKGMRDEERK